MIPSTKQKVWLFVWRFQPGLHLGHLDALQQALQQWITHFLIAIGSSNQNFTEDNPFTYDERKIMIERSLRDHPWISYQIFAWPDVADDEARKQYAFSHFPAFDAVITGNPRVRDIFVKNVKWVPQIALKDEATLRSQWRRVRILRLKMRVKVSATTLRQELTDDHWAVLKKYLSEDVVAYLQNINADKRIRDIIWWKSRKKL